LRVEPEHAPIFALGAGSIPVEREPDVGER
jgi:hypothetical protein